VPPLYTFDTPVFKAFLALHALVGFPLFTFRGTGELLRASAATGGFLVVNLGLVDFVNWLHGNFLSCFGFRSLRVSSQLNEPDNPLT